MNFFDALRKKTAVNPGKDFDRRFWAKFEAEFTPDCVPDSRVRKDSASWIARVWNSLKIEWVLLPTAATAAAAGLVAFMFFRTSPEGTGAFEAPIAQLELLEEWELVQFIDETGELSDDEWKILLPESRGGAPAEPDRKEKGA